MYLNWHTHSKKSLYCWPQSVASELTLVFHFVSGNWPRPSQAKARVVYLHRQSSHQTCALTALFSSDKHRQSPPLADLDAMVAWWPPSRSGKSICHRLSTAEWKLLAFHTVTIEMLQTPCRVNHFYWILLYSFADFFTILCIPVFNAWYLKVTGTATLCSS